MTTRDEHLLGLYAQHNAGMQQLISDAVETLNAFRDGNSSDPYGSIDDLIEELQQEQVSWQAQDTWGKKQHTITLDNFCNVCNGEGSVLNPDSGDGEVCLTCMGTGERHRTYDLPLILVYTEGGHIQHIIRYGNASVLIFDDMEDEYAFKKFRHIIEQTGGDVTEMEWEDVSW